MKQTYYMLGRRLRGTEYPVSFSSPFESLEMAKDTLKIVGRSIDAGEVVWAIYELVPVSVP